MNPCLVARRPDPSGRFFGGELTVTPFLPLYFLDVFGHQIVVSRYLFHVLPNIRGCHASCTHAHPLRSVAVKLCPGVAHSELKPAIETSSR
jgi:hypothetical protein